MSNQTAKLKLLLERIRKITNLEACGVIGYKNFYMKYEELVQTDEDLVVWAQEKDCIEEVTRKAENFLQVFDS